MSKTITFEEARHRLRTLAEASPDKVAGGDGVPCVYFSEGNRPSCIVGHAFWAELLEAGVEYGTSLNDDGVDELFDYDILDLDSDAYTLLLEAQGQQDVGVPWALAVEIAEAAVVKEREFEFQRDFDRIGTQLDPHFDIEENGQIVLSVN